MTYIDAMQHISLLRNHSGSFAMNKLGVHALVWEVGWSQDECARAIARTAEVGYDFHRAPALMFAKITRQTARSAGSWAEGGNHMALPHEPARGGNAMLAG
jgi:hypothetical protein